MMRQLRFWWGLRTTREQRMLLAMAAAIAIVLAWLLIVRPLDDALADARERHGRAVLDMAQARGQADRIAFLEKSGPPPPQAPLATLVGQKAVEAGFAKLRVTPDGNRVAIALESAKAQAFFGWIADLERRDGIIVERLSARTNSDATIAVDASLRARSR
ncbi:type II secretion system protein GspM [Sphingomonas profundi]|uniref:type II secretion system protein GspM n=1 Tax=Alterirhizorhabdus profundi TaxID=2681549 RepID=UPI0012E74023|nr:type II secretion system protein GspM [Sphingomonas profundi]